MIDREEQKIFNNINEEYLTEMKSVFEVYMITIVNLHSKISSLERRFRVLKLGLTYTIIILLVFLIKILFNIFSKR